MWGERQRHGAGATDDADLAGRLVETRTWPCADEDERLPMARLRPLVTMRRAMASAMKKFP